MPHSFKSIEAIGPFDIDAEISLLQEHGIEVIVSKNSGGEATFAKLQAARAMGLPVVMLARPDLPGCDEEFEDLELCVEQLRQRMLKHAI